MENTISKVFNAGLLDYFLNARKTKKVLFLWVGKLELIDDLRFEAFEFLLLLSLIWHHRKRLCMIWKNLDSHNLSPTILLFVATYLSGERKIMNPIFLLEDFDF